MELQHAQEWKSLSQEPFAAVGQWGSLAVVLLVLAAAGISRVWARKRAESAVAEKQRLEEGREEMQKDDWDPRVGYAS